MLIFYENKKYLHYHYLNKPTLLFMIKIHKKISIICLIFIVLSSCTNSDNDILDEGGEALYQRGIESMADGNYPTALAYFQALEANYPFSNLTRQAQLDIIYVSIEPRNTKHTTYSICPFLLPTRKEKFLKNSMRISPKNNNLTLLNGSAPSLNP